MSTIAETPTTAPPDWRTAEGLRRITVEEYERMIEAGVFRGDDRVSLIEGMLVRKMTKKRRHSVGSTETWQAILRVLPRGWHIEVETPVRLPGRDTLHEPDVSVVRGRARDYKDIDPGPPDVGLVVEVADSSVAEDRAMAHTYLGGGIPVYWLVNVAERHLEVYRDDPTTPTVIGEGGHADLVLDGQVVARLAVSDLLPDRP